MLDLKGKTVAILGAGRSGRAAAALASACGAKVTVFDRATEILGMPEGVKTHPRADAATGENFPSDLVVLSPGIETDSDFVRNFAKNSGALWGEIELAYRCFSGKIIAITGTNGKTTTTELVDVLIRACGLTCAPCGNYGTPFSEIALMADPPQVVALELSSFQLETIHNFRADARVWLNFSPDHMDRYRSVADYHAAKLRIFENLRANDYSVVRAGENLGDVARGAITFSAEIEADWSFANGEILRKGQPFVTLSETRLHGRHNAENIMAACAAVESVTALTSESAREALRHYAPPKHRCELIRTLDGVFYLNDSKATNLHAMESAIKSQDQPIVLIAGGKEKGLDYRPAAQLLAGRVKAAVVFGEIAARLHEVFSNVVECQQVDTLPEAVKIARAFAKLGDVVLFSPGTSSFDQFQGYEHRGDVFRKVVLALR